MRKKPTNIGVTITLTREQVLTVQACVQALAIQAEAEMQLSKAEDLHELDKELVQSIGRMACKSVIGMMGNSDVISSDKRIG